MGLGASGNCKNKLDKLDTFCIICYENDVKPQRLECGHAFCYDCILSIYDYEENPRCPLCRICLQTNKPLKKDFSRPKIGRKAVSSHRMATNQFLNQLFVLGEFRSNSSIVLFILL